MKVVCSTNLYHYNATDKPTKGRPTDSDSYTSHSQPFVCGGIQLLENKFNANKLENNAMINMRTGKQCVEGSAWCMVHAKVAIQTGDANRGGNQLHRVNWGDNT